MPKIISSSKEECGIGSSDLGGGVLRIYCYKGEVARECDVGLLTGLALSEKLNECGSDVIRRCSIVKCPNK